MLAFQNVQSAEQVESGNELTQLRTVQGTANLRSNLHPHLVDTSIWHRVAIESMGGEEFFFFCNHIESETLWASTTSKALTPSTLSNGIGITTTRKSIQETSQPIMPVDAMRYWAGQDWYVVFIFRLPPKFCSTMRLERPQDDTDSLLLVRVVKSD